MLESSEEQLQRALQTLRRHLGMEIAFISEFGGGQRTFRYVDCDRRLDAITPGEETPLEQTYCMRVITGDLPPFATDVNVHDIPPDTALTPVMDVRSYITVPVKLRDGSLYGTLCLASESPKFSLSQRDVDMVTAFAEMVAEQVDRRQDEARRTGETRAAIQSVIDADALDIHYQPIYDLTTRAIVGYEALSRFSVQPFRSPDLWFEDARVSGLQSELESLAVEKALRPLPALRGDFYISVNASPLVVIEGAIARLARAAGCGRVVLEVTEHAVITDYDCVLRACEELRSCGVRIAIDDAGSGYASFRHILALAPEFIKLDRTLTDGIENDASKQALAASFVAFADRTDSQIIAEGVETEAGLNQLVDLGVRRAQGYLLGRPAPFAAHLAFLSNAKS